MNAAELFRLRRRSTPGAPALGWTPADGGRRPAERRVYTYDELGRWADAVAAELARRAAPGERLALVAGNRPEVVALHLGAQAAGLVVVPVNTAYRPREAAHLLADSAPRLVVAEAERLSELPAVAAAGAAPPIALEELVGAGPPPPGASPPVDLGHPRAGGDDPALILYTSGTTGPSKGAVLSHHNLLATVTALLAAWAWSADDVLLLTLPLFHAHGLEVGLLTALAVGARVELRSRFDAAAVVDELAAGSADAAGAVDGGPTRFFGVPTMYVRLVEEIRRRGLGPRDFAGVRLFASGSAPLAPATFAAFQELTGHAILERYGMSETGMLLSNLHAGPRLPGTVGLPLPGVSVRLAPAASEEASEAVEACEAVEAAEGEVQVRGSGVFSGYFRAPEKTAASFIVDPAGRRWFRTGDLARRDPETGYYSLLGRRTELILRGGYNVYPREVEEVLAAFPGVREAAVAAEADAEWGEVPVAYLVVDDGFDDAALADHLERELAGFKQPVRRYRVGELPKNALGKVQKHRLRPPGPPGPPG